MTITDFTQMQKDGVKRYVTHIQLVDADVARLVTDGLVSIYRCSTETNCKIYYPTVYDGEIGRNDITIDTYQMHGLITKGIVQFNKPYRDNMEIIISWRGKVSLPDEYKVR